MGSKSRDWTALVTGVSQSKKPAERIAMHAMQCSAVSSFVASAAHAQLSTAQQTVIYHQTLSPVTACLDNRSTVPDGLYAEL